MFRGVVEANEIELQRPALRLAVDESEGWNWQGFGQALGNAAYLPHNVALTSVRITDGLLAVHGPDGSERTRFDGISGELSAPALEGPYRFKGTIGKDGAQRELRIGTARAEGDGSVRFKALLRAADGVTTYTLDGRIADLMGKPSVEGELTARLPAAGLWRTPRAAGERVREAAGERGEPVFDLRAQVLATSAGATLSNLALGFEQDGRPQMLAGEVQVLWRDALAVDMNLASRWLDLDRVAGAGDAAGPLESIVPIAIGLRDLLPAAGRSRATFAIDQANVGREAVNAIRLSLARVGDRLEIEELNLGLPGGSRGELKGVVSGPPGDAAFDGSISLRGVSLVRFLTWATAGGLGVEAQGDGTFGLRTQLALARGRASVRNLVGDISGTAITASAQYRWEGRPELTLSIEGPQLDARAIIPEGASLGDVFGLLLRGPVTGRAQEPGAIRPGWRNMQTDALVRVSAGELITAARTYRDVAMELELRGGRLRLPLLRVASDRGFSLELEGDVVDAASRPKGSLRGVVSADVAAAIAPLAELLGIPDALRPDAPRAQALVPLRLAGSIAFGMRTPTSADLVIDGEANGAAVKLNARLDGGQDGWRTGPADLTALLEGGEPQALAALVAPMGGAASRGGNAPPGRLLIKAAGVPGESLTTLASAEAGDLALSFRGKLVASPSGNSVSGDLDLKTGNGARIAALAGLATPLRLDGVPVAGTLRLAAREGSIAVERMALNVGGSAVSGQLALSRAGDRRRIEARVDVEEMSVAKLLGPLLDQRLAVAAAAETAVTGRPSPWPDEPFDATALDAFEGSVRLNARRLVLADGLSAGRASIDIALADGAVESRIEAEALGGRGTAAVRLEKVAAGADVSGVVRIVSGSMAALAAGKAGASGSINGEIKFAGRGTTPRSAVSVLQGRGSLELDEARLATLWPGAIGKASDAAMRSNPDELPTVVRRVLAASLAGGALELPRRFDVEIADGRLLAKPFAIATSEGRATGTANLDLKTFDIESDWRLDEPRTAGEKPPLPTVTVTYRGPIAFLGALEPRINSEALERELAVRRMERDVEELERLRKLDETRRREEAERLRRQFEAPLPLPPPGPLAPAVPAPRPATPG
jgi:hypothetical protein